MVETQQGMIKRKSQFQWKVTYIEAACIGHNMVKHLLWGIN